MSDPAQSTDREQPLIAHLVELRSRLLRALLAVFVVFLGLALYASDVYRLVASPMLAGLPAGSSMIATQVAAPFLVPFKLCAWLALILSMPLVLYQAWAFVAPGLYENERRFAWPLLISSILLFYAGMAFAYFVVFPVLFAFFSAAAPEGVEIMTDINHYLDFVLSVFLSFGLAFEVPVATLLLVWTGITTAADLVRMRPYIIVGAFVVGMVLTPPDVLSQVLLAVPIWLLFEAGLLLGRWIRPENSRRSAA